MYVVTSHKIDFFLSPLSIFIPHLFSCFIYILYILHFFIYICIYFCISFILYVKDTNKYIFDIIKFVILLKINISLNKSILFSQLIFLHER